MNPLTTRLCRCVALPALAGGVAGWVAWPPEDAGKKPRRGTHDAETPAAPPALARPSSRTPDTASGDSLLAEQRRFCERLRVADWEQTVALLEEAQSIVDTPRRRALRQLVLEKLALTDPARALDMMREWRGAGYFHPFLTTLARLDPEAALAWAEKKDDMSDDEWGAIGKGLVPDHIGRIEALSSRFDVKSLPLALKESLFRLLAADDPARALAFMTSLLPDDFRRNTACSGIGESWARRDVEAAYTWAKELGDPAQRESALRGVFRAWAETDPQGAANRLDELSTDEQTTLLAFGPSPVEAIARAWAAVDPKAAAAWLLTRFPEDPAQGIPPEYRHVLHAAILGARDHWSATEVADLLRRPGEKPITEQGIRTYDSASSTYYGDGGEYHVIGKFGAFNSPLSEQPGVEIAPRFADPARAFDDVARQPADAARQHVLHEAALQWAEQDQAAALARLRETSDDWLKISLINALAQRARDTADPELARQVAAVFPKGKELEGGNILAGIYRNIAMSDPERALALLAGGELETRHQTDIGTVLARRQAESDPAGAIAWAARQPDENLRITATTAAVTRWAETDAYETSEWLARQPAGLLRDAAVQGLISVLRDTSPEEALPWVETISLPEERAAAHGNVLRSLINSDPHKAKQLISELPLSHKDRKDLEQRVRSMEQRGY